MSYCDHTQQPFSSLQHFNHINFDFLIAFIL